MLDECGKIASCSELVLFQTKTFLILASYTQESTQDEVRLKFQKMSYIFKNFDLSAYDKYPRDLQSPDPYLALAGARSRKSPYPLASRSSS